MNQDGENNGEVSLADEIRWILLSIALEDENGLLRKQEDVEDDLWDALGPLCEREEGNRGRRPANQSIPNDNSQSDRRRRSCPIPSFSTMKDLAVFLVYNVDMDVLNKLRILTWDYDELSLDRFKVREEFLESLTDRRVEDVRSICSREERNEKYLDSQQSDEESQQSDEEYRMEINVVDTFFNHQKLNDWDCIQKIFFPISVEELTRAISNVAAPQYEYGRGKFLVDRFHAKLLHYESHSRVIVVSGERGCGKSSFTRRDGFANCETGTNAASIYHSLSSKPAFIYRSIPETCRKLRKDKTTKSPAYIYNFLKSNPVLFKFLKDKIKQASERRAVGRIGSLALEVLSEEKASDGPVFQAIWDMPEVVEKMKNTSAWEILKGIVKKKLDVFNPTRFWWKHLDKRKLAPTTIEGLVIVLDNMEKGPDLARGLVDEVEDIYLKLETFLAHYQRRDGAIKLVLVGTGLDRVIPHSRYPRMEFDMVQGPKLECLNERESANSIPMEDILGGTHSRILATNTRMFAGGVVPVMKSNFVTEGLSGEQLSSRRKKWGSSNFLMEYAVRHFKKTLQDNFRQLEGRMETVIANQFRVLMKSAIAKAQQDALDRNLAENPIFGPTRERVVVEEKDAEELLVLGLIASSHPTHTSPALCYLACDATTLPLPPKVEQIRLEVVLQHHLLRLSQVEHEGRFSRSYNLVEAWPPPSTRSNEYLMTEGDVLAEIENEMFRSKPSNANAPCGDIRAIQTLLEGRDAYTLVLRQTVADAQGADVLLLTKAEGSQSATLDLFRCKPMQWYEEALWSIGVQLRDAPRAPTNGLAGYSVSHQPTTGLAGYSYLGTLKLAEALQDILRCEVTIRHRCLVVAPRWADLPHDYHRNIALIKKSEVQLWTREMMEPTISAILPTSLSPPDTDETRKYYKSEPF